MLALEDVMDFHQLRQQGMSLRAISRRTGHHRQTITKYLRNGLKELDIDADLGIVRKVKATRGFTSYLAGGLWSGPLPRWEDVAGCRRIMREGSTLQWDG